MEFIFPLPASDRQQRQSTTLHLMVAVALMGMGIAGALMFWFTGVSANFKTPFRPFAVFSCLCAMMGAGLLLIAIVRRRWLADKRPATMLRVIEILLLAGITGGLLLYGWYKPALLIGFLSAIVLLSLFWEQSHATQGFVRLNEHGISVSGKLRGYRWAEIKALRLKQGVLSIEATGNRLWQENVPTHDVDEEVFVPWCDAQIKKHEAERQKEW